MAQHILLEIRNSFIKVEDVTKGLRDAISEANAIKEVTSIDDLDKVIGICVREFPLLHRRKVYSETMEGSLIKAKTYIDMTSIGDFV